VSSGDPLVHVAQVTLDHALELLLHLAGFRSQRDGLMAWGGHGLPKVSPEPAIP
jgi:hypothetical protein